MGGKRQPDKDTRGMMSLVEAPSTTTTTTETRKMVTFLGGIPPHGKRKAFEICKYEHIGNDFDGEIETLGI